MQAYACIVAKRRGRGGLLWLEDRYYLTLRLLTRKDDPCSCIKSADETVHERRVTAEQYAEADVGDKCSFTLFRQPSGCWGFAPPKS